MTFFEFIYQLLWPHLFIFEKKAKFGPAYIIIMYTKYMVTDDSKGYKRLLDLGI